MLAEVYFNLPLFSAFLLLIAGILLGYALWFPFRDESGTHRGQATDSTAQNHQELVAALQEQRDAYASLERKHNQQCEELIALRNSSRPMEDAERELESSRQSVALASRSLEELRATSSRQLMEERRLRATLEEELAELQRSSASALDVERQLRQDAESSLRQAQQQLSQTPEQHTHPFDASSPPEHDGQRSDSLRTLKQDYDELRTRYDTLLDELEVSHQARADVEAALMQSRQTAQEQSQAALVSQQLADSYAGLKDDLIRKLQALENQLVQQDSDQRTWADRYATMQSQYQELARQKSRLEAMFAEVQRERDELTKTVDSQQQSVQQLQTALHSQAQALESDTATASEVMALHDQLHYTQCALDQARAELSEVLADHQRLAHQRDQVVARSAELQEDLQHHQRALETVGRSHEKTLSQLAQLVHQHGELEQLVRNHEHTIETLRTNVIDLHDIQHKCVSLQCTIRDQTQELNAIRIDRDEVARQLAAGKTQWEQVQARIEDYEQAIDNLRAQREELLESLNRERARNDQLAGDFEEQTQALQLVSEKFASVGSLPQQVECLQHHNLQLAAELATLAAERDAAQVRAEESDAMLEQLQAQLASSRQSILALERDRDQAISHLRRHNVLAESQMVRNALGALVPVDGTASEPMPDPLPRGSHGRTSHLPAQKPSDDKAA